ncbi:MAG: NeuD/PglB/VioB family sugar acetyltransferase [Cyclobacteriaceae bacterium]
MDNPVIIFGAGGLGKAALEIFQSNDVIVYCFLDDDQSLHGQEIGGISILGSTDDHGYTKLIGKKCDSFVAIDDRSLREGVFKMLNERRKVMPINAIHPRAIVSGNAYISYGLFADAGAVVGSFARIGVGCILHSNAVIQYEATLGQQVQVGAGSVISAGAVVEDDVFIGAGVTIAGPVKIGKGARIGAGSVIIDHVKAGATMFGNPAKAV